MKRSILSAIICILTLSLTIISTAFAQEKGKTKVDRNLPKHDEKPADMSKPVKVFIMMGQSNMVGMGDISGGGVRWNPKDITDAVLSVYEGDYSPDKDYDALTPIKTAKNGIRRRSKTYSFSRRRNPSTSWKHEN